jgi:hypothetical protein
VEEAGKKEKGYIIESMPIMIEALIGFIIFFRYFCSVNQ